MKYEVRNEQGKALASAVSYHTACLIAKQLSDEEENIHEHISVCCEGVECATFVDGKRLNACEEIIHRLSLKPRNTWTDEDCEAYSYAKGTLESEEAERRYLNGEGW